MHGDVHVGEGGGGSGAEGKVAMKVAVRHGTPHRGEVVVVVMVMVKGPKGQVRHRRDVHRWGHREHVCSRRLPHPPRRRPCRLPSTLHVLWQPVVHLQAVEQPVVDGDPKECRPRRKPHVHVWCLQRRGVVDQHSSQAEADEVVPAVVLGRTLGVHTRVESSVQARDCTH